MTPLQVMAVELDRPTVSEDEFIDDLPIDSLEYIELIRRLEQVFDIRFDDLELQNVLTIGDLVALTDTLRSVHLRGIAHI